MKKSPEQIILAVAFGLLALVAAALAYTFPTAQDATGVPTVDATNPHKLDKIKPEDLTASLASLVSPTLWQSERPHLVFLSDSYLFYPSAYPSGDYIKAVTGATRTPSGVLISWYRQYGLDFTSPTVDTEDPDGDGFSNIVEFRNEQSNAEECDGTKSTNPIDPKSHPSYISRLRLDKYVSRPFHIQFRGYQVLNGQNVFQIYLKDLPSYQQPGFKKTGDALGYEGYSIGDFKQNIVTEVDPHTGQKTEIDKSTLELIKTDIGYKIPLVFRQEVESPESTASFVMLMPSEVGKTIEANWGKIFTIPLIPDRQFQVVDVKDTGAVIRDAKTKQDITVPKLNPAEWDEVPKPK